MGGRPSQHVARTEAHGLDRAGCRIQRDNRGFVDDDAASAREDAGIGGAEVNCQITAEAGQTHSITPVWQIGFESSAAGQRMFHPQSAAMPFKLEESGVLSGAQRHQRLRNVIGAPQSCQHQMQSGDLESGDLAIW